MNISRGGGRLATKINITFFVGIEVLNNFHLTIFSKKKQNFLKWLGKIIFMVHDHFSGIRGSDDKNEYVTWNIERDLTVKNCILINFSYHWYLYVMNAGHEFEALDWNYASVQILQATVNSNRLMVISLHLKLTRMNLQMWDHLLSEHWHCKN